MIDKLEKIFQRYDEVNTLMSDPAIVGDQQKSRELGKELRSLEMIVKTGLRYKKIYEELHSTAELLNSTSDPEMKALALEESNHLKVEIAQLEEELKILLIPPDPNDTKNFIMEIRAGTGGEEAALFASDVFMLFCKSILCFSKLSILLLAVLSRCILSSASLKHSSFFISPFCLSKSDLSCFALVKFLY